MTITKAKLKTAMSDWIGQKNPYAGSTIHFMREPGSSQWTDSGRLQTIARVKSEMKKIALRLDQLYFGERHVGQRIAAQDRFEAICVIEKLGVHPHVHLAWFLPGEKEYRFRKIDELLRLCCILETFNRGTKPLEARDLKLLEEYPTRRTRFHPTEVVDWDAKGWPAFSSSLIEACWPQYIFKEMEYVSDFSDQIFFLSELHADGQRKQATRYHSIDPDTGSHLLNFDAPLIPKR